MTAKRPARAHSLPVDAKSRDRRWALSRFSLATRSGATSLRRSSATAGSGSSGGRGTPLRVGMKKLVDDCLALNSQLGQEAYKFTTQKAAGLKDPNRCTVKFFNGELSIELSPAPYQNERSAPGWGTLALRTNARGWFSNLVLLPDPAPYGTWQQIDMEISGIMRQGAQPENRLGGKYEIIGNSRIVLGLDWKFLQGEWDYRTTMSAVNYSETPLEFDALINQLFEVLTEDGPSDKPPPPRQRGPLDGFGFRDI